MNRLLTYTARETQGTDITMSITPTCPLSVYFIDGLMGTRPAWCRWRLEAADGEVLWDEDLDTPQKHGEWEALPVVRAWEKAIRAYERGEE